MRMAARRFLTFLSNLWQFALCPKKKPALYFLAENAPQRTNKPYPFCREIFFVFPYVKHASSTVYHSVRVPLNFLVRESYTVPPACLMSTLHGILYTKNFVCRGDKWITLFFLYRKVPWLLNSCQIIVLNTFNSSSSLICKQLLPSFVIFRSMGFCYEPIASAIIYFFSWRYSFENSWENATHIWWAM